MARRNLTVKAKVVKHRNEALHEAMLELRSSSAASPHEDARTARKRTRHASKNFAIRDSWASA